MTEALDKELMRIDRIDRVHKFFKSIGSTDEQAATAAAAHAEKFVYDGAVLTFQGKPVADENNGVAEWFVANNLHFLLPAKAADNASDIPADLIASAKAGNMTSYSKIVREHGKAAADSVVAAKPAADDASKDDASKNPWRVADFRTNKDAQLRAANIIRSLGTRVAAGFAKSAGKDLSGAPLRG